MPREAPRAAGRPQRRRPSAARRCSTRPASSTTTIPASARRRARCWRKNGVETEVVYPHCCGMPQLEQGRHRRRRRQRATRSPAALGQWIDKGYDVIALVPSCALMLKFEWPLILPDDAAVKRLAQATFDISEYVVDIATQGGLAPGLAPLPGGVACTSPAMRGRRTWARRRPRCCACCPRPRSTVIERCSGHGGSWGVHERAISTPRSRSAGRSRARRAKAARLRRLGMPARRRCTSCKGMERLGGDAPSTPAGASIRSSCSRAPTGCCDGLSEASHMPAKRAASPRRHPAGRADYAGAARASGAARIGELKRRAPRRGRPVRDLLFRDLRDDVAAGAGDAVHREGGEAQMPDELEAYNPLIPQGRRAGRHGHDRDRRCRAPRERVLARLGGVEDDSVPRGRRRDGSRGVPETDPDSTTRRGQGVLGAVRALSPSRRRRSPPSARRARRWCSGSTIRTTATWR